MLLLPSRHRKGANGEIIDGVGVAPDVYVPLTAQDLTEVHSGAAANNITVKTLNSFH